MLIQIPDPILTDSVQKKLFSLISTGFSQKKPLKKILETIRQELPSAHTVLIKKNSAKKCTSVKIIHETPWICIICENNEPSIISQDGSFVPISRYRSDVIENLPTIMLHAPKEKGDLITQKKLLFSWAHTQPPRFFERFSVSWSNPYTLSLTDIKNPSVTIIASAKTKFDQKTDQLLDRVYQHIAQKEVALKHSNQTLWTVDLRFKGQLVLSHKPHKKDVK